MMKLESKGQLGIVDAIVFDCDGVLIDARASYDASILRTTETIVKDFAGEIIPLEGGGEGGGLILQVRRTGGFNSDWDTTYALTLFTVAALTAKGGEGVLFPPGDGARMTWAIDRLKGIVKGFSSRERLAGSAQVDAYLADEGLESETIEKLRAYLKYPGNPLYSPMTATFDQIYYGGALFREIYGVEPSVWYDGGLIDEERVLISRAARRTGGPPRRAEEDGYGDRTPVRSRRAHPAPPLGLFRPRRIGLHRGRGHRPGAAGRAREIQEA